MVRCGVQWSNMAMNDKANYSRRATPYAIGSVGREWRRPYRWTRPPLLVVLLHRLQKIFARQNLAPISAVKQVFFGVPPYPRAFFARARRTGDAAPISRRGHVSRAFARHRINSISSIRGPFHSAARFCPRHPPVPGRHACMEAMRRWTVERIKVESANGGGRREKEREGRGKHGIRAS
jgi:hypothetical protein